VANGEQDAVTHRQVIIRQYEKYALLVCRIAVLRNVNIAHRKASLVGSSFET